MPTSGNVLLISSEPTDGYLAAQEGCAESKFCLLILQHTGRRISPTPTSVCVDEVLGTGRYRGSVFRALTHRIAVEDPPSQAQLPGQIHL